MSEKTKYCPNCGEEIDAEAKICPECGVRVEGRSSFSAFLEIGRPASTVGNAALIGSILVIIGVFSPWASALGMFVSGLKCRAGILCLVLSFFLMGLVYFTKWSRKIGGVALFLSLLMFFR